MRRAGRSSGGLLLAAGQGSNEARHPAEVIFNKRDRSISVTAFQRVQKRSVLATFPAALDPKPEGQHRDAGQIGPEALEDLQENLVAGGRHDGFVKPVVQIGEGG